MPNNRIRMAFGRALVRPQTIMLIAAQLIVHNGNLTPDQLMAQEAQQTRNASPRYAIAVHGGAGKSPKSFTAEINAARREGLSRALKAGQKIISENGSALDAVERVVRLLEDDPQFNAGRGAVFNANGGHELDASIMDGRNLACGAVAGVTIVKNPISLARLVMTDTRHVLLGGSGAEKFAAEMDVELVDQKYFYTKAKFDQWKRVKELEESQGKSSDPSMGTVGCVALDIHGNLAAATSTGGLTNKRFGRIGDSPIIGAGTYADNRTCAVSCTGIGEHFIRQAVAFDVAALMRYRGFTVAEAVDEVIHRRLKSGQGGVIAVSNTGEVNMMFNTEGMARGMADWTGRFEVFWEDSEG